MKKFSFLLFLIAMVGITLSSSTCRTPPPDEEVIIQPEDSNPVVDKNVAGLLRIGVRVGTVAGPLAGGATVKLAYTFDSVNNEKYFISKITDSTGYASFPDLPVDASTKKKSYYANAFYSEGGEDLSSTNGNGSNGPLELRLTKNIASNQQLVVTYK